MMSVERLLEEAKQDRLKNQPVWVRELVHDLAVRLSAENLRVQSVEEMAQKEVTEARKVAAGDVPDADTFVKLPGSHLSDAEDHEYRALGEGITVEFRGTEDRPGEGFEVRMERGELVVDGVVSHLFLMPESYDKIRIGRL